MLVVERIASHSRAQRDVDIHSGVAFGVEETVCGAGAIALHPIAFVSSSIALFATLAAD